MSATADYLPFTYEKYRYDLILPWVACAAYLALFARHLCAASCDMHRHNNARNHPHSGNHPPKPPSSFINNILFVSLTPARAAKLKIKTSLNHRNGNP